MLSFTFVKKPLEFIYSSGFLLRQISYLLTVFFTIGTVIAQNTNDIGAITLGGYIYDSTSHDILIGSTIQVQNTHQTGISNNYGYYQVSLPISQQTCLTISYLGYHRKNICLSTGKDTIVNIFLRPKEIGLEEVRIAYKNIRHELPSVNNISSKIIQLSPSLFGEHDILKTIQLMPGVQGGIEGTSGLIVRGGGLDQNLILLDDAPVYNVSHLFGFFSVFTSEAIDHVKLIKGSFPARYGERVSSIVDIRMKEGNDKKISGNLNLGLLSAKGMLEGPIIKDKMSFMIAARRTYFDLLLLPLVNESDETINTKEGYFFYDINAKLNFKLNSKNRLIASFYTGKDLLYYKYTSEATNPVSKLEEEGKNDIGWKNMTFTLRYNNILSPKVFSNTTFIYANYKYQLETEEKSTEVFFNDSESNTTNKSLGQFCSGITDYSLKSDFDIHLSSKIKMQAGVLFSNKIYTPAVMQRYEKSNLESYNELERNDDIISHEINPYLDMRIDVNSHFNINTGFRVGTYITEENTEVLFQPRLIFSYYINEGHKLVGSYTKMTQPVHLLTNSGIGLPSDQWVPATKTVPQQFSHQFTAGYLGHFLKSFKLESEVYYKSLYNVIEYKEEADVLNTAIDWQDKVEQGKGVAYGMEMLIRKDEGKVSGWAGYSLGRSFRKFKEINNGIKFPFKYDRIHDFKLVSMYTVNEKFSISGSWIFMGGYWVTAPKQTYCFVSGERELEVRYIIGDQKTNESQIDYIPSRNNIKMPPYHRMDLSFEFSKEKKRYKRTWDLSIYNVYARKNPILFYWEINQDGDRDVKQLSLFSILPTVSYKIKF